MSRPAETRASTYLPTRAADALKKTDPYPCQFFRDLMPSHPSSQKLPILTRFFFFFLI